ncbi:hypothetical protein Syun_021344 [Stephania yunnanensis]|uniref:Uncharacterized protein n=1 Tax=Stephania yunnanensis TaxID=152371 RepID=A0AAP0NP19_9MAGN
MSFTTSLHSAHLFHFSASASATSPPPSSPLLCLPRLCLAAPEFQSVAHALASAVIGVTATPSPLTFMPRRLPLSTPSLVSALPIRRYISLAFFCQISSRISLASIAGSPYRRFTHHRRILSEQV